MTVLWRRRRSKVHSSLIFVLFFILHSVIIIIIIIIKSWNQDLKWQDRWTWVCRCRWRSAHSAADLQSSLDTLSTAYRRAGLLVNTKKTEVLSSVVTHDQPALSFSVHGDTLSNVQEFRKGTDKSVAIVVAFPCCRWPEKFLHVLCLSGFSAKLSTSSHLTLSVVFAVDVVPLIWSLLPSCCKKNAANKVVTCTSLSSI